MSSTRRRALVVLLLLIGVVGVGSATIDAPPLATFTNEDEDTYRITVFTPPDLQTAYSTAIAVTSPDGDRQTETVTDIEYHEQYRNPSVADKNIETSSFTIEPGDEVTINVQSWEPGDVTVYLIEEQMGNKSYTRTDIVTCTARQQRHSWTFEVGGGSGSSSCGSPLEWLLW